MSGIIKIVKSGEELVEDGATGEKFFAKYAGEARKVGTEANKIAEDIVQAKGFDSVENFLMTANKDLLDKLDELVDIEKGYKLDRVGHTTDQLKDMEAVAAKTGKELKEFSNSGLAKVGKTFAKKTLKYGSILGASALGAGYLLDEYVMPEYDELKRNCQCTCQGFNKINLNDEKWEQLNKILYCRHEDGVPCELENGECPTDCTLHNNNKKSASLYGTTDPDSFESSSPQYTDWKGKTDNIFCLLNNDEEFKDDFLNYHIKRATELGEVGAASGAALHAKFGSDMITGLGGAGAAAVAGEFIPSEFPGHCLYRLFDSSSFKTDPDDSTEGDDHQDLKVVKCQGGAEAAGPNGDGIRKKCSLKEGEEGNIIVDGIPGDGSYNNRNLGTCVAWNKSNDGKCMSVIHAPENVYLGLLDKVRESKDIDCSVLNTEPTCEESEYCYWHNENNFDDIYMCLNDVTLIKMHNDILDGGSKNLINQIDGADLSDKQKILSDNGIVTVLDNNKETDINDICNSYCDESLCNNPAITTMPAIPGINDSVDGIKNMIKYGILFCITLLLWKYIVSDFFKQTTSGFHIQMGMFNIKKLLSIASLLIMLGIVYLYEDKISGILKLDDIISDKILPFIEDNI